jgi:hypothetical protein
MIGMVRMKVKTHILKLFRRETKERRILFAGASLGGLVGFWGSLIAGSYIQLLQGRATLIDGLILVLGMVILTTLYLSIYSNYPFEDTPEIATTYKLEEVINRLVNEMKRVV